MASSGGFRGSNSRGRIDGWTKSLREVILRIDRWMDGGKLGG